MSLTSILSSKDSQELRNKFKSEFSKPKFDLKTKLKAPPLTKHYGIVGTAFDYLMRFHIEYLNQDCFIQRDKWIAEASLDHLTQILTTHRDKTITIGYRKDKVFKTGDLLNLIINQFNQSKINYTHYLKKGILTNELIENTIFLAKLDVFGRTGIIDEYFDNHDINDINDIKNMHSIIDDKMFLTKSKCYSNPTFGDGSVIVRGADADLIIDDTLIDFKATKNLKLNASHFYQTIGYYILSLIGGVNGNPKVKPIKNIGIYYARHGELWKIPLKELGNEQKFENFKKWFISYVTKN